MRCAPRRISVGFILSSLLGGLLATLFTAGPAPFLHKWIGNPTGTYQSRRVNGPPQESGPWEVARTTSVFVESWSFMYPGEYVTMREATPLTADPPAWAHNANLADLERRENPYAIDTVGVGWPLPAFRYIAWDAQRYSPGVPVSKATRQYVPQLEHGWTLLSVTRRGSPVALIIPTSPIWHGLIGDTAVWSIITAASRFGLCRIRAAIRRRRSLCPTCAYSRVGIAPDASCPECGRTGSKTR